MTTEAAAALKLWLSAEVDGIRQSMLGRGFEPAALDREIGFALARLAVGIGVIETTAATRINELDQRIRELERDLAAARQGSAEATQALERVLLTNARERAKRSGVAPALDTFGADPDPVG